MSPLPLTALVLAGCGSSAAGSPPGSSQPKTTLERDPAKPIAIVHGSQPDMSLGLISLRRYGPKVVTAKLRLIAGPRAPIDTFDVDPALGTDILDDDVSGMRLIDEVNGREHFVLEDADGNCLCSSFDGMERNSSVDIYAKFPAPPEGVTDVSLHVPTFPSFDNVRIAP